VSSSDDSGPGLQWPSGLHASAQEPVDVAAYSRYIGRWSALFVPPLLSAAQVTPGDHVLDVATGTGEAAMLATTLVAPGGRLVASDIATPMLRAARRLLATAPCDFVAADGGALPFADNSFDAVICQLGLMFMEPLTVLGEFARVLRSGRHAAVCVISSADRAPMWGALAEVLSTVFPRERAALQLSFSLADPSHLHQMFSSAGFDNINVSHQQRRAKFDSFDDYWNGIESGVGQLPYAYRSLTLPTQNMVRNEVRGLLSPYVSANGLVLPVQMLIAAGRA
jgi:ubiquinone/menaquinone biosynthesis C-methylase UbiE